MALTGMTAVLACFGSALLACSRTLYALAREGFAPQVLAAVHPRGRIPWNAQLLVLSLVAVLPIGLGAWQGSYLAAFGWGGQLLVFFVLLPYVAVNLANIVYHLRWRREEFHWLLNGLVPLLGIAIDGYVIYYAFFRTCWSCRSSRAAALSGSGSPGRWSASAGRPLPGFVDPPTDATSPW